MNLPKLRLVEKLNDERYLFTYQVDYQEQYTFISLEGDSKYKIEIGERPYHVIMIIEKESRMGKDITKQIN